MLPKCAHTHRFDLSRVHWRSIEGAGQRPCRYPSASILKAGQIYTHFFFLSSCLAGTKLILAQRGEKKMVSEHISSISVFIPLLLNGERYRGWCIATASLPFSVSLLLHFIHFSFSFSDRLHDPFDCFIHLNLWVQTAVTVNIGKIGNAQQWRLFLSLSLSMDHTSAGMLGSLNGFAIVRELNSASAFRGVNLAVSRSVCSDVCVGDNG